MIPPEPRWLNPDAEAAYIGVRVERLRPLVKTGKLPPPSYHLGKNQPRYDRLALDRVFGGEAGNGESIDQAIQRAVNAIPYRASRSHKDAR
jgi:hypothetical protein